MKLPELMTNQELIDRRVAIYARMKELRVQPPHGPYDPELRRNAPASQEAMEKHQQDVTECAALLKEKDDIELQIRWRQSSKAGRSHAKKMG